MMHAQMGESTYAGDGLSHHTKQLKATISNVLFGSFSHQVAQTGFSPPCMHAGLMNSQSLQYNTIITSKQNTKKPEKVPSGMQD